MKTFIIKNKAKIMAILSAFLMLSLTVLTVALIVIYTTPKAPTVAVDDDGNDYDSNQYYDLPSNLIFTKNKAIDAIASVNLQAIIKPETATDRRLEWSVAFVNNDSDWANGKTVSDYIAIDVNEADNTKATVNCLNAFGEKITITVVSLENSNANASCVLDCAQRVAGPYSGLRFKNTDIGINFDGSDTEVKFNINPAGDKSFGGECEIEIEHYPDYTVSDTYTAIVEGDNYQSEEDDIGEFTYLSFNNLEAELFLGCPKIPYDRPPTEDEVDYFAIESEHIQEMVVENNQGYWVRFETLSKQEQINCFNNITQPYFYVLTITIKGLYSSYAGETKLKCVGYTDYAAVEEVGFENSNVII